MPSDEHPPPPSGRVVAFVGSAGSIEALRTVLDGLDGAFRPAAIILVHQTPDRPAGALTSALGRHPDLDIREMEDGWTLRNHQILVIPAGFHLLVHPGRRLQLIPAGDYPPYRPSADLLLASMAIALGPEAVAVVLSGSGTDGATGATAIHANGGIVITTDEQTSRSFSMPRATIERDGVGGPQVVPIEEIAPLLRALPLLTHEP